MALFVGTYENKLDSKGRVSVPARFRTALAGQTFTGIVAYPAFDGVAAIEACGIDWLERLSDRINTLNPFSPGHRTLATAIFGRSMQIPFDDEGRILLPAEFRDHAGITDRAKFVAMGQTFLIWSPERFADYDRDVSEKAAAESTLLGSDGGK